MGVFCRKCNTKIFKEDEDCPKCHYIDPVLLQLTCAVLSGASVGPKFKHEYVAHEAIEIAKATLKELKKESKEDENT